MSFIYDREKEKAYFELLLRGPLVKCSRCAEYAERASMYYIGDMKTGVKGPLCVVCYNRAELQRCGFTS